jgi:hypothetical protein
MTSKIQEALDLLEKVGDWDHDCDSIRNAYDEDHGEDAFNNTLNEARRELILMNVPKVTRARASSGDVMIVGDAIETWDYASFIHNHCTEPQVADFLERTLLEVVRRNFPQALMDVISTWIDEQHEMLAAGGKQ